MAEFFHLNSQDIENPANAEDKVISREQRIFADNVIFVNEQVYKVKTTSTAYRQKLKFFVDVVEYTDPQTDEVFKYRCGYYYECEHYESVRLFTSLGIMSFYFVISKISNGEFDFAFFISNPNVKLYVSSVVFEDSFYNPEKGWLNPENPDNIIDQLEDDDDPNIPTIPGFSGGGNGLTPYVTFQTVTPELSNSPQLLHEDDFIKIQASRVSSHSCTFSFELKDDYRPLSTSSWNGTVNTGSAISLLNHHDFDAMFSTTTSVGFSVTPMLTIKESGIQTDYFWKARDGYSYRLFIYWGCSTSDIGTIAKYTANVYYGGRSKTDLLPV